MKNKFRNDSKRFIALELFLDTLVVYGVSMSIAFLVYIIVRLSQEGHGAKFFWFFVTFAHCGLLVFLWKKAFWSREEK